MRHTKTGGHSNESSSALRPGGHSARNHVLGIIDCCAFVGADADYKVAYALDINGRKLTGILDECTFRQGCRRRFDELKLSISVLSMSARDRRMSIWIHGCRGCCFFSGGKESVAATPRSS